MVLKSVQPEHKLEPITQHWCRSKASIDLETLPTETANRAETEHRQEATFFLIGPILFLYYEESLVSSNLNSKQLISRFHGVHPNYK